VKPSTLFHDLFNSPNMIYDDTIRPSDVHQGYGNQFFCLISSDIHSTVASAATFCFSVGIRIDFFVFAFRICEFHLYRKTLATRLGWLYWMSAILASSPEDEEQRKRERAIAS
jgi:hypothetical protein